MAHKTKEVDAQHSPVRYFIVDKAATHIAGHRVTDAMREDGVLLTPHQASIAVAAGAISTKKPREPDEDKGTAAAPAATEAKAAAARKAS